MVLDIDDSLYLGPGRDRCLELCRPGASCGVGNSTIAGELSPFSRRCVVHPPWLTPILFRVRTDTNEPVRCAQLAGSSSPSNRTLLPWLDVLGEIRESGFFRNSCGSDEPPRFCGHRLGGVFAVVARPWKIHLGPHGRRDHAVAGQPYQTAKCGAKTGCNNMAAGLPVIVQPLAFILNWSSMR